MQLINWKNHTLSKLCLGTVQFGLDYGVANKTGEVSKKDVADILEFVLNSGINTIDTGSMYGNSEEKIGNFIEKQDSLDINIISKIKSNFFKLNKNEAIKSIEKSLDFLFYSPLFALLLHDISALQNWDKNSSELIGTLKSKNYIKYFGISIYTNKEFEIALNNENIDVIQIPFNLFDQRAITFKWLDKAKEKNKLIFIRSVYLQGLLLMDKDSIPLHLDKAKEYITILDEFSQKLKMTKNELTLSFVNQVAKESIVLFGCDNLEQAKQNISNFNNLKKLDKNSLEYLKIKLRTVEESIYNPTKWNQK